MADSATTVCAEFESGLCNFFVKNCAIDYDSLLQSYNLGPPIFCENVENVESELNIPGKDDVIALELIADSVRPVVNLSQFGSLGCTDDANLRF